MTLTTEQRLQNLEATVGRIEAILGDWNTPPVLSTGQKPPELPNGRYNLKESDYQLHQALDTLLTQTVPAIRAEIQALKIPAATGECPVPLKTAPGAVAVREMRDAAPIRVTPSMLATMQHDATSTVVRGEPHAFMGDVGIGGMPIKGLPLVLRGDADVVAMRRVSESSTQEKNGDRVRIHSFSASGYDNGMRMIKGAVWINGQMHISATDPIVDIVAMDSQGKLSKSREDFRNGARVERGQLWCVWEELEYPAGPMLWIQGCMAGLGIGVVGSTQTMNDHNPNPNDRRQVLIEPIKQWRAAEPGDLV